MIGLVICCVAVLEDIVQEHQSWLSNAPLHTKNKRKDRPWSINLRLRLRLTRTTYDRVGWTYRHTVGRYFQGRAIVRRVEYVQGIHFWFHLFLSVVWLSVVCGVWSMLHNLVVRVSVRESEKWHPWIVNSIYPSPNPIPNRKRHTGHGSCVRATPALLISIKDSYLEN